MFHALLSGDADQLNRSVRGNDNDERIFHARAVRGRSGDVHAVLGGWTSDRELPMPPPPTMGAWEWDVPPLITRWSADLHRVYGYPVPPGGHGWWEAPEFFGLLEVGERARMRAVLERFHHAQPDDLIIHSFEARHAQTGEIQRLRLAGRTVWERGAPRWFRGVTMRVDTDDQADAADQGLGDILAGALALSTHPVCLVDITDQRIYLRTHQWGSAGFADPEHGKLTSAVHPEDTERLLRALACARESWHRPTTCTARFATATGWRSVEVSAVSVVVHRSFTRPHVLIKLRASG